MRSQIVSLTFLFLGGGTGTLLRYGVVTGVRRVFGLERFPLGTLLVNIAGCLAIGLLWQALAGPWSIREDIRIAIIVGLLGGFTTFSSFGLEVVQLWGRGHYYEAIAYVLLSNALGFAAVWVGTRLPLGGGVGA